MTPEQAFLLAQRLVSERQARKPVMEENNTPEAVVTMLKEELAELDVAMAEAMLTGDVWTVASEIADVLYLSFYLCEVLGFNGYELVTAKSERNELKYPPEFLQEGEYKQVVTNLRKRWSQMGGDTTWSYQYLESQPYQNPDSAHNQEQDLEAFSSEEPA